MGVRWEDDGTISGSWSKSERPPATKRSERGKSKRSSDLSPIGQVHEMHFNDSRKAQEQLRDIKAFLHEIAMRQIVLLGVSALALIVAIFALLISVSTLS